MRRGDQALKVIHVRIISALYFGFLAFVAAVLVNVILHTLDLSQGVTVGHFAGLALLIAGFFGFIFGEGIMHCSQPYYLKSFALGFMMVLLALPFYVLGLMILIQYDAPQVFAHAGFIDYLTIFALTWAYGFLYAGVWLAILGGLAAMFLRSQLVYDVLRSQLQKDKFYKAHHLLDEGRTPHPVRVSRKS